MTADIEKAFLQLALRVEDRDAMRFYFPSDPLDPSSPMKVYRFKAVVFGASCSPFLLAAVIKKHIETFVHDQAFKDSLSKIFVDNLMFTSDSEEVLEQFYYKAKKLFSEGGFNLDKWGSNSKLVEAAARREGVWDDSPKQNVLGKLWNNQQDQMEYKSKLIKEKKYTKRIALRTTNRIYDPLGFIVPTEIRCRLFIQKLWKEELDWDKSFSRKEDFKEQWDKIVEENRIALTAKFPRQIKTPPNVQLHIMSDASKEAYGAVAYFVVPKCEEYPEGLSQIAFSKGRITKKIPVIDTIPRLELLGLTLAAVLVPTILQAYPKLKFARKVLWSDSTCVLGQCSSLSNDKAYVHNGVIDIRNKAKGFKIRHIEGKENPADFITKPIKAQNLLKSSK